VCIDLFVFPLNQSLLRVGKLKFVLHTPVYRRPPGDNCRISAFAQPRKNISSEDITTRRHSPRENIALSAIQNYHSRHKPLRPLGILNQIKLNSCAEATRHDRTEIRLAN
jgi:hypothetical protein